MWNASPMIRDGRIRNTHLQEEVPFKCPKDMTCTLQAPAMSASELMSKHSSHKPSQSEKIPQIIHQCWFGSKNISSFSHKMIDTWRNNHPEWKWVLWNEHDNRKLVEQSYPWFLETFDALGATIKQADAVRNLYMHKFGGMYVDVDVESLRNIDALFKEAINDTEVSTGKSAQIDNKFAFFGRMGKDRKFANSIGNDWMAASAGHSFFLLPILSIMLMLGEANKNVRPELITGPVALRNQILEFEDKYPLKSHQLFINATKMGLPVEKDNLYMKVFDENIIHPLDWNSKPDNQTAKYCYARTATFDPSKCKEQLKPLQNDGYAFAYWSHGWE